MSNIEKNFAVGDLVKVKDVAVANQWIAGEGTIIKQEFGQYRLSTGRLYPAYCLELVFISKF